MSRNIGVISDTHGLLRPAAVAALQGSGLILHAGDVGDLRILAELGRIAPVHAVYGNTDWGEVRGSLPRTRLVDLGARDGRVAESAVREGAGSCADRSAHALNPVPTPAGPLAYVHHGDRELDLDPPAAGIALVVSGHTHRPLVEERGGVLYLNPGSAGPGRSGLPATIARVMLTDDGGLRAEIVPLGGGGRGSGSRG